MSFGIPVRNGLALGLTPSTTLASGRIGGRPALLLNFISTTALPSTITFSRGTQATLTDSTGKITYAPNNLLTNSESFEATAWTKANGTVTANAATAPDGTLTADKFVPNTTSASHAVQQTVTTSGTVVVSFYAKAAGYSYAVISSSSNNYVYFDVANGAVASTAGTGWSSPVVTFAGNGWYRCSAVTSVANTRYDILCYNTTQASGNSAPTFAGDGTSGIFLWGAQVEAVTYQTTPGTYNSTTPKNLLGYTQEFDNAAWTKSNSFVQTNFLLRSQELNNAAWGLTGATVSADVTAAPDGTTTADRLVETTATSAHFVSQASITSVAGAPVTLSFYLKKGSLSTAPDFVQLYLAQAQFSATAYANYNIATGALGTVGAGSTATITSVGNGWYRCTLTATASVSSSTATGYLLFCNNSGTAALAPSYTGATTSDVFVWGAQAVQGATAGDYQPTYAAAAAVQYAAPDGTLSADKLVETTAAGVHNAGQSITTVVAPYTFSTYIKAAERTFAIVYHTQSNAGIYINLSDGTSGTAAGTSAPVSSSVTAVGNGWYRCSISVNATAASNFFGIYSAPNSTTTSYTGDGTSGIYVWGAQLSNSASLDPYVYNPGAAPTSAAYYGPRFDYDPVTLAPKGLLIEEQRTNNLNYSEQFDNTIWTKGAVTVTANSAISPDGTQTADTLTPDTANLTHRIYNNTNVVTTTTVVMSAFVKSNGYNKVALRESIASGAGVAFDLSNGTVLATYSAAGATASGGIITPFGNGWFRISCAVSFATATSMSFGLHVLSPTYTSGDLFVSWTPNGTSGVFIYGAQFEAGAFATSYIPTVASTVTRSADVASMLGTNFSSWYNATQGTLVVSASQPTIFASSRTASALSYSATGSRVGIYRQAAGPINGFVTPGAGAITSGVNATANTAWKGAIAYDATTGYVSANGSAVATGGNTASLGSFDNLGIGGYASGNENFCGYIRTLSYYNTRLTNTQLQALTA